MDPHWLEGFSAFAAIASVAVAYVVWLGQKKLVVQQQELEKKLAEKRAAPLPRHSANFRKKLLRPYPVHVKFQLKSTNRIYYN